MRIESEKINEILGKLKVVVRANATFGYEPFLFVFKDRFVTCNSTASVTYMYDLYELGDEFAIEFDKFAEFCKNMKGKYVDITTDKNTMTAKSGKSKVATCKNMNIFDAFKDTIITINDNGFSNLPSDFIEGLAIANEFTDNNTSKPATNFLKIEDDTIESTNGYVLCRYILEDNIEKMFIKYSSVSNLVYLNPDKYKIEGSKIYFKTGNCYYVIAVADIKYFDFGGVIRKFDDVEPTIFEEDIVDQLKIASIAIAKNKAEGVFLTVEDKEAILQSDGSNVATQTRVKVSGNTNNVTIKAKEKFLESLFNCSTAIKILPDASSAFAKNDRYCVAVAMMEKK